MIFKNLYLNDRLVDIETENGKIKFIGKSQKQGIDMKSLKVFPGLIDIHTHGCFGMEAIDGNIEFIAKKLAEKGTTSFLPTTATVSIETICNATNTPIKNIGGANVLGFHLEGPYISEKYKGAQDEKYIRKPNIDEFKNIKNIKMITVAPEIEGAMDFIKQCNIIVSLGHTNSDYETAIKAIENGAECLTHTFNAMPPMLHRNSGVIGAAIEKGIYAQLICDGLHVEKGAVWTLYKALGADKVILISDSIKVAGMEDGEYTSGGLFVTLKNGSCRLKNGTLAGSVFFLLDCVKKAIDFGIPIDDAFKMASETPAKLLGLNKGIIKEGYDADMIFLDENLDLKTVVIAGEIYL